MSVCAARRGAFVASPIVIVIILGAASSARAELPLTLTWVAPAGCPTATDVRVEVERLVRFPPGHAPPALVAEGHVEAREGRWRLRLRTERDGLPGERELETDSCASLSHAAALVMALAFGVGDNAPEPSPPHVDERPARPAPRPRAVEPAPPPPPVEPPPPPPVAPPPEKPSVVVATPAPPRSPTAWSVAAETLLVGGPLPSGTSPRFGWGAGVGLAATRGRFMADLRARAWLPTDDAVTEMSTRMQLSGEALALSLCSVVHPRWGTFALCALGGAGALGGTSTGGLTSRASTAPWYSAGMALDERLRLWRRLHLEIRMEIAASLTRPQFVLTSGPDSQRVITTVYTVRPIVPEIGLGLSFDL